MRTTGSNAHMALMVFPLLAVSCSSPPPSTAGSAGFREAYFDKELLQELMMDRDVDKELAPVSLRFYNMRRDRDDVEGTAMVIATNERGSDLYATLEGSYKYYDVLGDDAVREGSMTRAVADEAIEYVADAGDDTYAADFPRADVRTLLSVEGCTAVRMTPERTTAGDWTMRMTPVSIRDGVATTIGDASITLLDGEPCPTFCGHMEYLHMF